MFLRYSRTTRNLNLLKLTSPHFATHPQLLLPPPPSQLHLNQSPTFISTPTPMFTKNYCQAQLPPPKLQCPRLFTIERGRERDLLIVNNSCLPPFSILTPSAKFLFHPPPPFWRGWVNPTPKLRMGKLWDGGQTGERGC